MSINRRLATALVIFTLAELLVTTPWTGWLIDKRLDPLLAIAPRIVTLTLPVLMLAGQSRRLRLGFYAGLVAVVGLIGLFATAMLGERMGWMQHLVLGVVSLGWMVACDWLVGRVRARWPGGGRFATAALWVATLALALVVALCAGFAVRKAYAPPPGQAPLTLMTGLPLVWGEGEDGLTKGKLTLDGGAPAPALVALKQRFAVDVIDAATPESLPKPGVLLLAHPKAMAPAELVALDDWLRRGGKALILADAFLAWEPPHALGDPRNPPITSLLTPMLDHWGLDLVLPANGPESPLLTLNDGGQRLHLVAAGVFARKAGGEGVRCEISLRGVRADCAVGKGRAILVSDADLLHDQLWLSPAMVRGGGLDLSPALWRADNIGWVSDQLDDLAGNATRQPPLATPVWIETRPRR